MTRQSITSALFIFFLIVLLSWLQPVSIQAQEVNLDVPFVPTPYEVVDEMLRLAELKKGDILTTWAVAMGESSSKRPKGLASGRWE